MTRIVNVKRALELTRRPADEGSYTLEVVDDPRVPANKGRWRVEFDREGSRVASTTAEPDLRCDIPSLSQLVTGYRTLENALRTRQTGLECRANRETLDRVFTQRPQHVTENF
jgi:predicted acetyltransferase